MMDAEGLYRIERGVHVLTRVLVEATVGLLRLQPHHESRKVFGKGPL